MPDKPLAPPQDGPPPLAPVPCSTTYHGDPAYTRCAPYGPTFYGPPAFDPSPSPSSPALDGLPTLNGTLAPASSCHSPVFSELPVPHGHYVSPPAPTLPAYGPAPSPATAYNIAPASMAYPHAPASYGGPSALYDLLAAPHDSQALYYGLPYVAPAGPTPWAPPTKPIGPPLELMQKGLTDKGVRGYKALYKRANKDPAWAAAEMKKIQDITANVMPRTTPPRKRRYPFWWTSPSVEGRDSWILRDPIKASRPVSESTSSVSSSLTSSSSATTSTSTCLSTPEGNDVPDSDQEAGTSAYNSARTSPSPASLLGKRVHEISETIPGSEPRRHRKKKRTETPTSSSKAQAQPSKSS